ncbi:MAG: response regulator [Gammaproteobacteria bacterium]|nr:response regulator [Gammaproteobacteria bacterium]
MKRMISPVLRELNVIIDASASNASINSVEKPVILVVEDSRIIRLALKKMLQKEYTLLETGNAEEAWKLLQDNESIQVVFSDLSMPELDGFGLLARIRSSGLERISKIPFIAITGNEEDENILQQAVDCGATDLVTKPFQSSDIKDRAHAYTRHLTDAEIHSSSAPSILDEVARSVDNLSSIDQELEAKREKVTETESANSSNNTQDDSRRHIEEKPGSKIRCHIVEEIASRPGNDSAQRRQDVLDEQNLLKDVQDFMRSESEAVHRTEEAININIPTEEKSALARKIEEHARQQEALELIRQEDELETVVAFDVQQRIHGNYRVDQGNKVETEMIRLELEKKLATEREQQWVSCSFCTRFTVYILERINTLPWVNLDNKIKNILKRSAR